MTKSIPKAGAAQGRTPRISPATPKFATVAASSIEPVRKALRGKDRLKKLEAIAALQADLHAMLDHYRVAGYRDIQTDSAAAELNRIIGRFFEAAAKILSAGEFEEAFGFKPQEPITLVNPEIMASVEPKR